MRSLNAFAAILVVASTASCSASPGATLPDASEDIGSAPFADAGNPADARQAHPDAAEAGDAIGPPADAGVDTSSPEAGTDSAVTGGTWSPVSFGVTTRDTGGGDNIVIAYGGYTATDADSQAWVTQLTTVRLAQLGVGHLYAVRGPQDADYAAREIGNSELAAALANLLGVEPGLVAMVDRREHESRAVGVEQSDRRRLTSGHLAIGVVADQRSVRDRAVEAVLGNAHALIEPSRDVLEVLVQRLEL